MLARDKRREHHNTTYPLGGVSSIKSSSDQAQYVYMKTGRVMYFTSILMLVSRETPAGVWDSVGRSGLGGRKSWRENLSATTPGARVSR